MNEIDKYELIDRYLTGDLSRKELEDFISKLASDEEFAQEVETQRMANNIIFDNKLVEIKNKLRRDYFNKPTSSGKWWKNGLIVLSGLLLLSGAGYLIITKEAKTTESNSTFKSVDMLEKDHKSSNKEGFESHKKEVKVNSTTRKETTTEPAKADTTAPVQNLITTIPQETDITTANKNPEESIINSKVPQKLKCNLKIGRNIESMPTCEDGATGIIEIQDKTFKDGVKPYKYSINGSNFAPTTYFKDLKAGKYLLVVKDHSGCMDSTEVTVASKACLKSLNFRFNPDREAWKFPIDGDMSGKISIVDKSGTTLYNAIIINGDPSEWDGRKHDGSEVQMGAYVYIIELSNGKIISGYITIIR